MDSEKRNDLRAAGARPGEDRPLSDLFRELGRESAALLKSELELARAELRQSLHQVTAAAKQLTLGGAIGIVGLLTLTAFAVVLLGTLLGNYWLGALIVAALLLAIGGVLIYLGLGRLREAELAPNRTMDSLRVTGTWAGAEVTQFRETLTNGRSPGAGGAGGTIAPLHARPQTVEGARPDTRRPEEGRPARDASEGEGRSRTRGSGSLPKRVGKEILDDDILGEAAKVAYYAFLALPPALLVVFSLFGFFGGETEAQWLNERLQASMPEDASSLVEDFVTQIIHGSSPGPFSIGLLLALWAASNVFVALGNSLNNAYDVSEDRSWFKRRGLAIGVMLAAVLLMLVASVSLIAGPQIASALNLWGAAAVTWNIIQWPLAFLFVGAAFYLVYYALPNRDQSDFKVLLGKAALIAAALWLLASFGFRMYVSNFASYSETYGFLGAVIVLLLWLYVTGLVVLVGGEIASEMEKDR